MPDAWVTAVVGVLAVGASLFFLVSGVALLRARDAITRVNLLGPATGVGVPLMILAALVHHTHVHGWSWTDAGKSLVAIAASLVVSSVASFTLGRAAYRSGAELDPHTAYDELQE